MSCKYKGIELINLKCNIMSIPKISKLFKSTIDDMKALDVHSDHYFSIINKTLKDSIKDEWLEFDLRRVA